MKKKGESVPDFELPDQNGTPRRLSDLLKGGPVVLFFYPAAMTYGCTKESCHFRDLKAEFDAVGAQRVGISADKVEKQKQFSDKHGFDYPLLSDGDSAVIRRYGILNTEIRPGDLPARSLSGHLRDRREGHKRRAWCQRPIP